MNLLSLIYGIIFKPKQTFAELETNFNRNLFLYCIIACFIVITLSSFFYIKEFFLTFLSTISLSIVLFLIGFIFKLEKEDFFKLLSFITLTYIPELFRIPIQIIAKQLPVLETYGNLIIMIWQFNLLIIAVSTVYKISKSRTILLFLIPTISIITTLTVFTLSLFIPSFNLLDFLL